MTPFTSTEMRRLVSIAVMRGSSRAGLDDRAGDHDLGHVLPVLGRGVDVAGRVEGRAEPGGRGAGGLEARVPVLDVTHQLRLDP